MVRKQVYIHQRQEATLKRLARQRGLSEAEIIRQAIDREAAASLIIGTGRRSTTSARGGGAARKLDTGVSGL